ncbi:MAG: porin family protein [Rickettsiaceae bacterium]
MKKILLTTAAAAVLATSSAHAAEGNFFVKANAGWSKLDNAKQIVNYNGSKFTMKGKAKNDAFVGIGVGYNVMDNVRVDLTFDHFFNPTHKLKKSNSTIATTTLATTSKLKHEVNTLLLNGYVDLFDISVAKVFAGAGVGVARISSKTSYTLTNTTLTSFTKISSQSKQKQTGFSYAAYLGAAAEVAPGVHGELTYSFRDFGKTEKYNNNLGVQVNGVSLRSHNVAAGVRFDI